MSCLLAGASVRISFPVVVERCLAADRYFGRAALIGAGLGTIALKCGWCGLWQCTHSR
jgi:hypothetical protein